MTNASAPADTTNDASSSNGRRGRKGLLGAAVLALVLSGAGAACGTSSDDASDSSTGDAISATTVAASDTSAPASAGSSSGGSSSGGSSSNGGSSGGSGGGGSSTPAPVINSFATPESIDCHNGMFQEFTASWSTTNATRVTISIDGPGIYAEYGPSGETSLPFNCNSSHTFLLTAYNQDGTKATKQITLQPRNVQGPSEETDATQP
jgi:hypothetical protein